MSRIHDALKKAEQERSYRRIALDDAEPPQTGPIPVVTVAEPELTETVVIAGEAPRTRAEDEIFARFAPPAVWKPNSAGMLFFDSECEPPGTEEFRSLRSRLYQIREKTPLQKVMIASSLPQEGKSFIAVNLALALALQPGCRTLLIDADLRNPSLHRDLGTPTKPGLTEFLLDEEDEFAIVQRGPMENLFFISSGRPVSGQSEVLSNGRLKVLFDRLESLFDWIIVDSPAALPVSDAGLIAKMCDGILVAVRSNSTPFDVVRKALRKLPEELVVGVVLNGIPAEAGVPLQRFYSAS